MMRRDTTPCICFVTNELYPVGPGGIGRMLYNFAKHNEVLGFPADIHFLVAAELMEKPDAADLLDQSFDQLAQVHVCPTLGHVPDSIAQLLDQAHRAAPWKRLPERQLAASYGYYMGLRAAEEKRDAPFDVIEFPDFGGWGQVSVEAKRAGIAFSDTLISARIHSTQGVIYRIERFAHHPGMWAGVQFDAERHLLSHADLVIGHDPAVLDFNKAHYNLVHRWEGRTILEFPPIQTMGPDSTKGAETPVVDPGDDRDPDFIFSSRLQHIKRPDLFIRAAIAFLEQHPSYGGAFRIVAYGWDKNYIGDLQELVPKQLKVRIPFLFDASEREREDYLRQSIVVVPSEYESLCLFAFEASQMGLKVILNGDCPAFGQSERWCDGDNCLLFDGSVPGLVQAMGRALEWHPNGQVTTTPDTPYWLLDDLVSFQRTAPRSAELPRVSVVCFGFETKREFHRHVDTVVHLESELRLNSGADEIVFLLPRGLFEPGAEEEREIVARGWRADFTSGLRECPSTLSGRLSALKSDCVLLYPCGYEIYPDFLTLGLTAMGCNPFISAVGGHVEVMEAHSDRSDDLRAYLGEMPSVALLSSRIAPPTSLIRLDLLDRIPFDAHAGNLWFEVFARECALKGESILIAPVLTSRLDATYAGKRQTTKTISGSILDMTGIALQATARLLSVDPVAPPEDGPDLPFLIEKENLQPAMRLHPQGKVREWEPVQYHAHLGGLLVHPLQGDITLAEITGPDRMVRRFRADIRNANTDNQGAEGALALVPEDALAEEIVEFLKSGEDRVDYRVSDWQFVSPGEDAEVSLSVSGPSRGRDRLLMLTRIPENGDERNCHLVFRRIEAWFNENLI